MFPYPSSIETLIAFGIVFLLGLTWSRIHRHTCRHANPRAMEQAA